MRGGGRERGGGESEKGGERERGEEGRRGAGGGVADVEKGRGELLGGRQGVQQQLLIPPSVSSPCASCEIPTARPNFRIHPRNSWRVLRGQLTGHGPVGEGGGGR